MFWGFRGGAPRRGGVRKTVWTRIGKEIPAFAGMTVCGTRGQSGCRQGDSAPHWILRLHYVSLRMTKQSSLSKSVPKACR